MMRELRDFVNNYDFFYNDHDNEKLWGPLILEHTEKHISQIVFAQMHIFSPAWAKNLHKFVHIYTNYV